MSPRLAYSLAEAAQLSSLSVRSLRYLMQQGKLGFAKVGRRILIPHAELERLIRRASVKPTQTIDADESIRPRGKNVKAGSTTLPAQEVDTAHSGEKAVPFEVSPC
jgi:excisionase family DNA binding protein